MTERAPDELGVSLAQYAGVQVGLSEDLPLVQVLRHEGVDAAGWQAVEERWSERLFDADGELEDAFDAAMAEARARYARSIAPLDDDLRAWLDFVRHFGSAPEPLALLAAQGMNANDVLRLQARWSQRLGAEEGLARRAHAILETPPEPLPPIVVQPRPFALEPAPVAAEPAAPTAPEVPLFAPLPGVAEAPVAVDRPPTPRRSSAPPPFVAPPPAPSASSTPPPDAGGAGRRSLQRTLAFAVAAPIDPLPFRAPSPPPRASESPPAGSPAARPSDKPVPLGATADGSLISPLAGPATPFRGRAAPPAGSSAPAPAAGAGDTQDERPAGPATLPAATPFERPAAPRPVTTVPRATPFDRAPAGAAQAPARPTPPAIDLDRYAWLSMLEYYDRRRLVPALAEAGLATPADWEACKAGWGARLAADVQLAARFRSLVNYYRRGGVR
ncbi:MAG: hypothetical protein HY908_28840 [Myxococcales bacterium]|nr:hypothetical protein [Myxococcales bacterium]